MLTAPATSRVYFLRKERHAGALWPNPAITILDILPRATSGPAVVHTPRRLKMSRQAIKLTQALGASGAADRLTYWLNRLVIASLKARTVAVGLQAGPVAVVPLSTHDLRNIALTGIYEPDVARFAQTTIRPGDLVVDIGAHIGINTLIFGHLVGPDGIVHSFEPDPGTLDILGAAVQLNSFTDRIVLHEAAVGDANGHTHLFSGEHGGLTNSTVPGWTRSAAVRSVRVVSLDSVLLPLVRQPIGLLKIDVEGAENSVLDGAHELLTRYPPRGIIVEVTSRVDAAGVLSRLAQHGFSGWDESALPKYTGAAVGEADFAYTNVCVLHPG
jgi:FkbM family methyltransferase